jgi:hypothetical protein
VLSSSINAQRFPEKRADADDLLIDRPAFRVANGRSGSFHGAGRDAMLPKSSQREKLLPGIISTQDRAKLRTVAE